MKQVTICFILDCQYFVRRLRAWLQYFPRPGKLLKFNVIPVIYLREEETGISRVKYKILCDTFDRAQPVFGVRIFGFFVHINN